MSLYETEKSALYNKEHISQLINEATAFFVGVDKTGDVKPISDEITKTGVAFRKRRRVYARTPGVCSEKREEDITPLIVL